MELLKALNPTEAAYLEQLLSNPTKNLADFADVELTIDEIAQALITAKSVKGRKIEEDQRLTASRERYKLLMQPFTPDQLIDFCFDFYQERFNKEFLIDKENEALITVLAKYFTGSQEFNIGEFNLNKGILLMGNVGNGKTEIMKFFQRNKKQCYEILPCSYVADQFKILQDEFDKHFSTPRTNAVNDSSFFFQKHLGRCFDDLGTEELKNDFGNKKNTMADVIMAIYAKKDFTKTFITTNFANKQEIEAKYGTRVLSRMVEMFNVFVLEGNDRRNKLNSQAENIYVKQ